MGFESLIGNNKIKQMLTKAIKTNQITHSYLFVGTSGIGKTLFAKEFAKAILCQQEEKACGNCKSCLAFEDKNHTDFIEIIPQEKGIKIEQIRQMQEKVLEKPVLGERKVYLIKDADSMTREAQNCLLKTLEEPPSFITIILVASNESLLLTTIKSRCTKVAFNPIANEELINFLKTQEGFENITPNMIQSFGGSIEKAKKMQEKQEVYAIIEQVFSHIEENSLIDAMQQLKCLYENKEEIHEMLDYINVILLQKAKQNPCYLQYIETVEQTKRNLRANSNYDMSIDYLLYQIWEE